jgi:Flp pilus assembly protein TadG
MDVKTGWRTRRVRASRGGAREGGAELVELAIVLPLVLLLLFGIVEFGMAYNNSQNVRQGVRDSARQGAVAQFGSNTSCMLNGTGAISSDTNKLMCSAKTAIGAGSTGFDNANVAVRVELAKSDLSAVTSSPWAVGEGLVVCAEYKLSSVTGLLAPFISNKVLKTRTIIRIEQAPPGVNAGFGSETDLGPGWGWCDALTTGTS